LVSLVCVDPKEIKRIWPHASHLIRSAVERVGISDFRIIEDSILDGDALLWLVWDGSKILAAVSTVLERANGKLACVIVACGGEDMSQWLGLITKIEDYAKAEGCHCTRIYGRKGWTRVLTNYRAQNVILERPL